MPVIKEVTTQKSIFTVLLGNAWDTADACSGTCG